MNFTVKLIKIILSLAIVLALVNFGLIYGVAKSRPEITDADAAIILGAAINTPALTNRTMEGLRLYEAGKVDKLVLSGGKISDSDISEAQYMEKVIKRFTNQPVDYILEQDSHSTYDNIRNSKQKLEEAGIGADGSVVIVSDEFHLARGVLMAKRAGYETVYWSAPEPDYYSDRDLRFYYLREFVAMLNYLPKFIFG